jgi:cell division protein FtsL
MTAKQIAKKKYDWAKVVLYLGALTAFLIFAATLLFPIVHKNNVKPESSILAEKQAEEIQSLKISNAEQKICITSMNDRLVRIENKLDKLISNHGGRDGK